MAIDSEAKLFCKLDCIGVLQSELYIIAGVYVDIGHGAYGLRKVSQGDMGNPLLACKVVALEPQFAANAKLAGWGKL